MDIHTKDRQRGALMVALLLVWQALEQPIVMPMIWDDMVLM